MKQKFEVIVDMLTSKETGELLRLALIGMMFKVVSVKPLPSALEFNPEKKRLER